MALLGIKLISPRPALTLKLFLGSLAACLVAEEYDMLETMVELCIAFSVGVLCADSGISISKHGSRAILLLTIIGLLTFFFVAWLLA